MTNPTPLTRRQQLIIDHDKLQQMVTALAQYNKTLQTRYGKPDVGPADMLKYFKQTIRELTDAENELAQWNQLSPS